MSLPNNNKSFNRSSSNPDLSPSSNSTKSMSSSTNSQINDEDHSAFVVKVYRSDQSFKYFPVHKVEPKNKGNMEFYLLYFL